jgi:outer membrane protein TolC
LYCEDFIVKRILLSAMMALSLSACSIVPKPLTTGSLSNFADNQLANVTSGQEPVTHAITLYEAMSRALLYNLDFQVELYNEALANKQLDTARLDTLPDLVASAGYVSRNNKAGNRGTLGKPDRERFEEDIILSWNLLDLGLSKIRAEQAADEVLVAREKRRKIINRVIEDVRTAYWRAVSADSLIAGLRKLEGRAQKALKSSASLQKDGQTSPLTALTYQRELVEIQQRIQRMQKNLSLAKIQLAALMNLPPDQQFTVAQPVRSATSTELEMTGDEMVYAALENRPEIRDIQYQLRINEKETKKALLELLPTANLLATANWNSDSLLVNGNWLGWGARATWNLLNVFKYPAQKRLIKATEETLDQRALAITMAIMTQVHVSRVRYIHAKKIYKTAAKHLEIQTGIVKQIRSSHAEGQASEQTLIREEMNTLASRSTADVAYADLQNAYANVYASMGIDPYAEDLRAGDTVADLAAALADVWIERGDRSGAVRARRSAEAHVVTGSIKKPVDPKAVDPIVAETHGWANLEAKSKYDSDIVHVEKSAPKKFWANMMSGGDSGPGSTSNPRSN